MPSMATTPYPVINAAALVDEITALRIIVARSPAR